MFDEISALINILDMSVGGGRHFVASVQHQREHIDDIEYTLTLSEADRLNKYDRPKHIS